MTSVLLMVRISKLFTKFTAKLFHQASVNLYLRSEK